jgi:cytochrome c
MRYVGSLIVLSVAAAVGLSFVHPFGNPRVEPAKGLDTLLRDAHMPDSAKAVLISKCADCHSTETRWPVYARVAPGSWLIERDIVAARGKMDLSKWEELPGDAQDVLTAKIIHEAKQGDMPPPQYLALHWGARLSQSDVAVLSVMGKTGEVQAGLGGAGDAERGKIVFEKRCTGCHAMQADRDGPRLAGVYGRRAGSVSGFTYSTALKNSRIDWNDRTLDQWLSDPDLMIPQNNMDFSVPKAAERRDLIAYLKQTR